MIKLIHSHRMFAYSDNLKIAVCKKHIIHASQFKICQTQINCLNIEMFMVPISSHLVGVF